LFDIVVTDHSAVLMSGNLERLKVRRSGNRGIVVKLTQESKLLLDQEELPEKAIKHLKKVAVLLKEKANLLAGLDEKFIEIGPIEEIEGDIVESDEIASRISDQINEIQQCLEQLSTPANKSGDPSASKPQTIEEPAPATGDSKVPLESLLCVVRPKLPKLTIAKFSGEVIKFRAFWDSFNSAVHNNRSLSDVDKFSYLQGLLEGPAATAIQGLTLSNVNYQAARELLEQRFAKPQYVIAAHMDQMYKLPNCKSDRASQLRSTFDKLCVHVRGLEAVGISAEEYGKFLIPVFTVWLNFPQKCDFK